MHVEHYDRAAAAWIQALEINPQFAEASYNLGTILYQAGQRDMARCLWAHTVELDPDFQVAWYNLGALAFRSGDTAAAESAWSHCSTDERPLSYSLFHVIVDHDRNKSSLAQHGTPTRVVLAWLTDACLLTSLTRRIQVDPTAMMCVLLLPEPLRNGILEEAGWTLKALSKLVLRSTRDPVAHLIQWLSDARSTAGADDVSRQILVSELGFRRLPRAVVDHSRVFAHPPTALVTDLMALSGSYCGFGDIGHHPAIPISITFTSMSRAVCFYLQWGDTRLQATIVASLDMWSLDLETNVMRHYTGREALGAVYFNTVSQEEPAHFVIKPADDGLHVGFGDRAAHVVKKAEQVASLCQVDLISVEVSRELLFMVDPNRGAPLLRGMGTVRTELARELGVVLPGVRFRDNLSLPSSSFAIQVREALVGQGVVQRGKFLASGGNIELLADLDVAPVDYPACSTPAAWIDRVHQPKARSMGFVTADDVSVVVSHIEAVARRHVTSLFGLEEAASLVTTLRKTHPHVADIVFREISLGLLHRILTKLLEENVSIRDLALIIESLANHVDCDEEAQVEHVRRALGPALCEKYAQSGDFVVRVLRLADEQAVAHESDLAQKLRQGLGVAQVLTCAPDRRPALKHWARLVRGLAVLSTAEIVWPYRAEVVAILTTDEVAP